MSFWITKFISALIMPPLSLLLLAVLGLLLAQTWRRPGITVTGVSLVALWMACVPIIGDSLVASIEPRHAPDIATLRNGQAIVILGGGTYFGAPEYGGDTVNTYTLERVRWGARLHRETGLPVLVTGGMPFGNSTSEAAQMRDTMVRDFQIPVRWLEERANNTAESALLVREILAPEGINSIVLVTHAHHMLRSHRVFEQAGFKVLDAPTAFSGTDPVTVLSFLPSAHGLAQVRIFCRETLGLGWYHVLRLARGGD